ncbi:HNH endonuclease [Kitasatospora cineracea]|uniref:HNH endonuclease n=1 Tax=Kitasatospora cineracea TaxID=88074 RepID=UPI0036BBEFB7
MRRGEITEESVLKAIEEHDDMGREEFLSHYGFRKAQSYVLVHQGREYDSKAIAGVAHKWAQGEALPADGFSGGKDHAAAWLRGLGFTVREVKNPDWVWDEVILACDLVASNGWHQLDADDQKVQELSELLQLLPFHGEDVRGEKFRDRSNVARKTADIATGHPDHEGKAAKGGATDRRVLREFLERPEEMAQAARLIRAQLATGEALAGTPADGEPDEEYEAPEGRLLMRRHQARERDRKLRKRKIDSVLGKGGTLACEVCGFDYQAVYGERGAGYVECHHVVPLHVAGEGTTKLADLALICANCHRMIHRKAPWPTPAELREAVEGRRGTGSGGAG